MILVAGLYRSGTGDEVRGPTLFSSLREVPGCG